MKQTEEDEEKREKEKLNINIEKQKKRKRDFYPPNSIARVLVLFSKKNAKEKENSSKPGKKARHFIILVRIVFIFSS